MEAPKNLVWALAATHREHIGEALRHRLQSLDLATLPAARANDQRSIFGNVEVIRVAGYMDKLPGYPLQVGSWASVSAARNRVRQAAADPAVGSILLAIDSPGGSVDGLAELGDAVYAARQVKPVVAQVDGMAASAAYYVASQASLIYAHRMDMVGSIGTYMLLYDFSKMLEKEGIEPVLVTTGDYKGAGAPGVEITKAQREDFQRIVDAYFADFLSVVGRGRAGKVSGLKGLADGRVFVAAEALAAGLIDGVKTFEETLTELNVMASKPRLATADIDIQLAERATMAPSTPSAQAQNHNA